MANRKRIVATCGLLILSLGGCATAGKTAADDPNRGHGTLLAALKASASRHEYAALPGRVVCYEGTPTITMKGGVGVLGPEQYMRRATQQDGSIIQDSIQLFPEGPPIRYLTTIRTGPDGKIYVTEAQGAWDGEGQVVGERRKVYFIRVKKGGAMVVQRAEDRGDALEQVAMVIPAQIAQTSGLMDVGDVGDAYRADQDALLAMATYKSEVVMKRMDPDACFEAFGYFTPLRP